MLRSPTGQVLHHWVFVQVLQGSGGSVWTTILVNTQCRRHCSDPSTKCSKRISWDAWKHRLHALGMEKLSICLAGDVQRHQRRLQSDTWGGSHTGPLDLALLLWYARNSQWHQCAAVLSYHAQYATLSKRNSKVPPTIDPHIETLLQGGYHYINIT